VRKMATFYIYRDNQFEFRWRLKSNNGRIVADSGEGYETKQGVQNSVDFVKINASGANVVDLTV